MSDCNYDVAVIGGGPAGACTAGLIAKAGLKVAILEEHQHTGEPVQCAGLITPRCFDILGYAKDTILNRVNGADIHSPGGMHMHIGAANARAVVIDRAAFDRRIMEKAQDTGATLISGKRVKKFARGKDGKVDLNRGEILASLAIGADGAKSASRDWLGLGNPTYMLNGFTADVSGIELEQGDVQIFFGKEVAPNFFAWMIPAGDVTRLGLCIREGQDTAFQYFKRLFKTGKSAELLKGAKIVKRHSGVIPLGLLPKTHADSFMLVGDAACQVKATSGGGIYPGLVCAKHCAEIAINALESGDCSSKALSKYHENWMADIGDELDKALMMHRIYSSLNERQLEDIFGMMLNPEIQEIINQVGDIDYPSKLAWVLLRKEPGFLKYTGKFIRHGLME